MTNTGMQIRPIKTEQDHRDAIARIEKLMSAVAGSPEGDELDVLATLVDAYESKQVSMKAPDPVAMIEFCMEQRELSRKDLEAMIGSRARVSEVMTGKRSLTLAMIRRLRDGLGISADLLIHAPLAKERKPSATRSAAAKAPRKGMVSGARKSVAVRS